jgi:hypothetical protein
MQTLSADLHPDTLERATTDDLAALIIELVEALQPQSTFCQTALQHDQPELIEAIETLSPHEAVGLAEQVCRMLRLRLEEPSKDLVRN